MTTSRWSWLVGLLTTTVMLAGFTPGVAAPATASANPGRGFAAPLQGPLEVTRRFAPPGLPWEPGNRGVDLAAHAGEPVYATTAGVVLYAGELAGRGVISIRAGTLRTTYEPVNPVVHAGDVVAEAEVIGYVSDRADSCGPPGSCLHWGALRSNVYIDPMGLLRAPAIRLLPIWNRQFGLGRLLGEFGP